MGLVADTRTRMYGTARHAIGRQTDRQTDRQTWTGDKLNQLSPSVTMYSQNASVMHDSPLVGHGYRRYAIPDDYVMTPFVGRL